MKILIVLLSVIAINLGLSSFSHGQNPSTLVNCSTCTPLVDAANKIKNRERGALLAGRKLLTDFNFSTNKDTLKLEIEAYLNMAYEVVRRDDSGNSDAYLYNAFNEYPKEFSKVIGTLTNNKKKYIQKAIQDAKKVFDEGNG